MNDDLLRAAQAANQQAAGLSLMRFQVALTTYAKIWEYWLSEKVQEDGFTSFDDQGAADAAIQAADYFLARLMKGPSARGASDLTMPDRGSPRIALPVGRGVLPPALPAGVVSGQDVQVSGTMPKVIAKGTRRISGRRLISFPRPSAVAWRGPGGDAFRPARFSGEPVNRWWYKAKIAWGW